MKVNAALEGDDGATQRPSTFGGQSVPVQDESFVVVRGESVVPGPQSYTNDSADEDLSDKDVSDEDVSDEDVSDEDDWIHVVAGDSADDEGQDGIEDKNRVGPGPTGDIHWGSVIWF